MKKTSFVSAALLCATLCFGQSGPGLQPVQVKTYSELNLAWDGHPNWTFGTNKADIAGCNVYWGNVRSGFYTNVLWIPGPAMSCTLTNNIRGPVLYIAGTAKNNMGNESAFSNELITTNECPIPEGLSLNPTQLVWTLTITIK